MSGLAAQFRHIARRLRRAPMFTVVTLITLAIGIGANTAMFSVIHGVLLKPLPYNEPDRLATLSHTAPGINIKDLNAAPSIYFLYREENRVFEDLALWRDGSCSVTGLAQPERTPVLWVNYPLFSVLRTPPAAGRAFSASDDRADTPETVMLSYAYWQRKFGGDKSAIGRRLMVDGKAHEIIGVMPRAFQFLDLDSELFVPLRFDRAKVFIGNFGYQGIARLKPGVTLEQANADAARMLPLLMDRFPMPPGFTRDMFKDTKMAPAIHLLKEDVVGDVGKVLWVLMGTVGIVLLIACANVANLFLVRVEARQQELAVRAALGAGWGRIARDLLAESVGLGLTGGLIGVGLAYAGVRLLVYLAPANLPRLSLIAIDPVALLFALAISVVAGVLFALIPVIRVVGANPGAALKQGGRSTSEGKPRHRARSVLVVAQIALALVLLVSAGLMIRTFAALRKVDPGFVRPVEVLSLQLAIPDARVKDSEQTARVYESIADRVRQLPGVQSVAIASSIPMDSGDENDPIFVEEFPTPNGQIPSIRRYKFVSPGYFQTMGNRILAGRDISWSDVYATPTNVLLSWNLARQYWKTPGDALGKRVRESPKGPWRTVIGVVGDERTDGVGQKAPETAYWPLLVDKFWGGDDKSIRRNLSYVIRSPRTGASDFLEEVRKAVWSVDSSLPVAHVRTLQGLYNRSMGRTSFTLVMLGIAAAMALLLGIVGIYGVISYSVAQRTREIGIRMALGAEHQAVRRLFVRHGLLLVAVGVVLGAAAAVALTRGMSALLFEVSPMDPATYFAVAAVLAVAAMFASYLPARRATNVDPARALRSE